MPTSLLLCRYRHASEPGNFSFNVDANDADRRFIEQEKFWEMIGFEFIRMIRVIDAEAAPPLKQDDPSNVVIDLP